MEKEGLVRAVNWLDEKSFRIGTIVTDRHRQITKHIRLNLCPRGTRHYYDVCHVAKGDSSVHKEKCTVLYNGFSMKCIQIQMLTTRPSNTSLLSIIP